MKVHNPIATVTNAAYILLGYLVLPSILGWFLIALGIVSTGFHWTRSKAWHTADIVGIYYMFAVTAGYLIYGDTGTVIGIVVGIAAHWSYKSYSRYSNHIIGSLGLIALVSFGVTHSFTEALIPLGWFAGAFAFGQLAGHLNKSEDTVTYDVLHGVWHLMSAMGIWIMIR